MLDAPYKSNASNKVSFEDGYVSIPMRCSHNGLSNGFLDEEKFQPILDEMLNNGFYEIKDFSEIPHVLDRNENNFKPSGKVQIRYTKQYLNVVGKEQLITGGFIFTIDKEFNYLMYNSHSNIKFSVQREDVIRIWIKAVQTTKKNEIIVFDKINNDNKIEVKINDIIVKKCRDNYDANRFRNTKKYKQAVETNLFTVLE